MEDVWESDVEEEAYERAQRERQWKQLHSTHAVVSFLLLLLAFSSHTLLLLLLLLFLSPYLSCRLFMTCTRVDSEME